ncbi:hypothetical protein BDN71DRAFT_1444697 [Pleurotus eryngii]|uniref:Uncharacterized protein n=1 Tax=Pleurotus eryngii TaxID=5323 RepID=A0A9P6DH52_PLEER|nr:hypothetical protein BDN71DRAFT_1444697 [Pleurotus eryngii]
MSMYGSVIQGAAQSTWGSVNSASWNPINQQMFVLCPDDRTTRMWEVDDLGVVRVAHPDAVINPPVHRN